LISRRLNLLIEIASMLAFMDPEEALKMTADVQDHPRLHRVRGWALLNADRFDDAIAEFEQGFSEGDVACGVYAHRKLREDGRDPEKFDDLETALVPYFNGRNVQLMYSQMMLALDNEDFNSAFTNAITILTSPNKPTVDSYGSTFFSLFTGLLQVLGERYVKNPESPTEEEMQKTWDALNDFFFTELKTAEGNSLEWIPLFYLSSIADYLFREIEEGHYGSAYVLAEFNEMYEEMIDQIDPPKRPETFSNEFIWNALLKSLEHGSVSALECAREFAENNGFPVKEVEKYEEEFKAWGFDAYGY
jgi:hypothetical protein